MSSGIPPIPLHAILNAQWVDDCLQWRNRQSPDTSALLDASPVTKKVESCVYGYCRRYAQYFSLKEGLKDVLTDGSD